MKVIELIWQASDLLSAEPIRISRTSYGALNPNVKEKCIWGECEFFSTISFVSTKNLEASRDQTPNVHEQ